MNKLFKSFYAVVLAFSLAGVANAAVIASLSAAGETTTSVAHATVIDFNAGVGYASASGDHQIVSGNLNGKYTQPAGTNSPYLTVSNGSALFGLGTTANYFGLYWGSIDSHNSISFYLGNALVASFGGAQISPSANGHRSSSSSNRYVNFLFTGSDMFDTVRITNPGYAFESDNHAFTAVPEPQTLALLMLGLLGLALARRQQRQA